MAMTITEGGQSPLGSGLRVVHGTLTGDASYAGSGGETVDFSTYFTGIPTVLCVSSSQFLPSYIPGTNATDGKILVRDRLVASLAEVTATTDLSATSFYFLAIGDK